jgi:hypothetical protein
MGRSTISGTNAKAKPISTAIIIRLPTRIFDRPPDGDWKLLAGAYGGMPKLYDLTTDPTESRNMAMSEPSVRGRLFARLRSLPH